MHNAIILAECGVCADRLWQKSGEGFVHQTWGATPLHHRAEGKCAANSEFPQRLPPGGQLGHHSHGHHQKHSACPGQAKRSKMSLWSNIVTNIVTISVCCCTGQKKNDNGFYFWKVKTIEDFALDICEHFLTSFKHVTNAEVFIEEAPWRRLEKVMLLIVRHQHWCVDKLYQLWLVPQ